MKNKPRGKPFEKGHRFYGDLSNPNIFKKGVSFFAGRRHSEETKEKISRAKKGRKNPSVSLKLRGVKQTPEIILKRVNARKGYRHSIETRKKMSNSQKGEKASNWKGGISPLNKLIRRSVEFKLWREAIFKRDNYTCLWCRQRGGILHPDHIKPFAYYPELRFAIDNGRTLCKTCHMKTNTWGGKSIRRNI